MPKKLTDLPLGSLIKFGKHQVNTETPQDIIWLVADKNHSGYPANSVTLIAAKIIDLRSWDSISGKYEDASTKEFEYRYSNINQWLNSNATAGNWWVSQYSDDTEPTSSKTFNGTPYADRPGFLYNFTTSEQNAILPTTFVAQRSSSNTTLTAKVFLPSPREVGADVTTEDGSVQFAYFTTNAPQCGLTAQAYNNTLSSSKPSTLDANWYYNTRNSSNSGVRAVSTSSNLSSPSPKDGSVGVRPVINLTYNTKMTDTTDSDGCYTILNQTIPDISGVNFDLGVKTNYYSEANGFPEIIGFTQPYTVTDMDGDTVTVKEYIDNVEIRSRVVTLGVENIFDVTGKTWAKLSNGTHSLKILATDGIDEVTRIYNFTKSIGLLAVQLSSPIASSTKPTNIIVTVVKNIPYNAKMKVEVCNNGFDSKNKIVWETIEDSGTSVFKHTFNNKACESGRWGVNIRVTVDRNGSEGACYITEIGGNFE